MVGKLTKPWGPPFSRALYSAEKHALQVIVHEWWQHFLQAVETCVPAPAHCSAPFAFAHLCKQVNVNICVNFFARQNPHLVHTSATCYECQRNFDPNVAHFVPISFRVNATPNETDYI